MITIAHDTIMKYIYFLEHIVVPDYGDSEVDTSILFDGNPILDIVFLLR